LRKTKTAARAAVLINSLTKQLPVARICGDASRTFVRPAASGGSAGRSRPALRSRRPRKRDGTKRGTFQPPIRDSALATTRCPEAPVAKSRCLSHGTEAGAGLSEPCARDDYARARTRESAHACSRDPLCSGRVARSASSLEVGERDSVQLRTRSHTAVRSSGPRRLPTFSRVQHDLRLE